jgi:hypothetical protein
MDYFEVDLSCRVGTETDPGLEKELGWDLDPVSGQESGLESDQEMDPGLDYFGLNCAVHNRI